MNFREKKGGGAKAVWSFSENSSKSDNPIIPKLAVNVQEYYLQFSSKNSKQGSIKYKNSDHRVTKCLTGVKTGATSTACFNCFCLWSVMKSLQTISLRGNDLISFLLEKCFS